MDGMQNRQTVLFSATQTPEVSISFMLILVEPFIHDFYNCSSYALTYPTG